MGGDFGDKDKGKDGDKGKKGEKGKKGGKKGKDEKEWVHVTKLGRPVKEQKLGSIEISSVIRSQHIW